MPVLIVTLVYKILIIINEGSMVPGNNFTYLENYFEVYLFKLNPDSTNYYLQNFYFRIDYFH
jgi:hypothetical protein